MASTSTDRHGNSPAPVQTRKTRFRARDRDIRENEKSRASLHAPPDPKMAKGNPMRIVPDVPGFSQLSKQEIKRDTRDIEKRSSLITAVGDTDSDEDEVPPNVNTRPKLASEFTIHKKRRRMVSWAIKPGTMEKDLDCSRQKLKRSRDDLSELERGEEEWLYSLDIARRHMTTSLTALRAQNGSICEDGKQLLGLAINECSGTLRKRGAPNIRDVMNELRERQLRLNKSCKAYERAAKDYNITLEDAGVTSHSHPPTEIFIQELDYPEDRFLFAGTEKSSHRTGTGSGAGSGSSARRNAGPGVKSEIEITGPTSTGPGWRRPLRMLDTVRITARLDDDDDADEDDDVDLLAMISTLEDTIRMEELSQYDLDVFFPEEDLDDVASTIYIGSGTNKQRYAGLTSSSLSSSSTLAVMSTGSSSSGDDPSSWCDRMQTILQQPNRSSQPVPSSSVGVNVNGLNSSYSSYGGSGTGHRKFVLGLEEELKLAQPFMRTLSDAEWMAKIDRVLHPSASSRRKRKPVTTTTVPLLSSVLARTPGGVPLLVSPLSQFEDRFVGSVLGSSVPANYALSSIPEEIKSVEDEAILKGHLQSSAASAQTRYRRLVASNAEWQKQAQEVHLAVFRAEMLHNEAIVEERNEVKKNRQELIHLGLTPDTGVEMPMSPMLPTSGNRSFLNPGKLKNKKHFGGKTARGKTINQMANLAYLASVAAAAAATATATTTVTSSASVASGVDVASRVGSLGSPGLQTRAGKDAGESGSGSVSRTSSLHLPTTDDVGGGGVKRGGAALTVVAAGGKGAVIATKSDNETIRTSTRSRVGQSSSSGAAPSGSMEVSSSTSSSTSEETLSPVETSVVSSSSRRSSSNNSSNSTSSGGTKDSPGNGVGTVGSVVTTSANSKTTVGAIVSSMVSVVGQVIGVATGGSKRRSGGGGSVSAPAPAPTSRRR